MRVIFNMRKFWIVVLGSAVVIGSLVIAASSQKAQDLQSRSEIDSEESSYEQGQRRMLEQRPLVSAASMIRSAIDRGGYEGYSSIVIEDKGVALWWKGDLPEEIGAVVEEASKLAPVRIAQAEYSWAELKAAAALMLDQIYPGSAIQAVKYDPTGAGLILSVPDTSTTKAIFEIDPQLATSFITQSLPALGVPTRVIFEEPPTLISRDNDSPPWSGGAEIINTSIGAGCTSGWPVRAPSGPAILTAGHCGNSGNRFTDGVGQFIGNVSAVNKTTDVLIIPTTSVSNRIYVGGGTSTTTKTVTRSDNVFIGEFLCQSGNTSANVTGNPVCNLQVINFGQSPQFLVEAVQRNNQTAARPGDSGGPVYSDQGSSVIAKGTTTYVAGCCRLGFQDFVTAQQDLGVSIVPPSGTGVVFFQHINFGGASTQPLARGNYTLSQLQARGFINDWASSVRIPSGFTVIMYQHDNFVGTSWTRTSDTPSFVNLVPNANDQVSSVRIQ